MRPSQIAQEARQAVEIEERKPLTRRQYLQLCIDQNGRCGCGCGFKLDPMGEGVQDEHLIALAYRSDDPNALKNRSLWRTPCSKAKDKADAPRIAKAKRLAGETCTGSTKPIPSRENPWPPKGSRKLGSRRISGVVERRG